MASTLTVLLDWFEHHELISWWLGSLSLLMFLGFLIAVPVLIVRLPDDYFLNQATPNQKRDRMVSLQRIVYLIIKNIFGVIFILAGFAMLFLPGQGIITLIMGISLLNIPGKHHLFMIILKREKVFQSLNRLRARFNKPAFHAP